ncbi:MAG: transcriptional regulator GutM [Peptostreptococcaceae bacterium]|nr:transcriptional regulator GutM [Peptostreptococcaceae bacterium]
MKSRLLLVMISIMAWLINGIFVYIQIKDFDKNYIEMRKNGE